MEHMSEERAKKIYDVVVNAALSVKAGSTPDEALFSEATRASLLPEEVKRAAEAFNVRATLGFLKEAKGDERAMSFPIASPEGILSRMYPADVDTPAEKAASLLPDVGLGRELTDFKRPPTVVKSAREQQVAAAVSRFPLRDLQTLLNFRESLEKQAREQGSAIRAIDWEAAQALDQLALYFRKSSQCLPFDQVEAAAVGAWPESKPVMDLVWDKVKSLPGMKRASAIRRALPRAEFPFILIRSLSEMPGRMKQAQEKQAAIASELDDFKRRLFALEDVLFEKEALSLETVRALAGTAEAQPKGPGTGGDPLHEAELRGIRTQSLLHDLMTGDEVISRHNPQAVLGAFNAIAETSPRLADNRLALTAALRKLLEAGGLDEFDVANMAKTQLDFAKAEQGPREVMAD